MVEGHDPTSAEAAKGLDKDALSVEGHLDRDGASRIELSFETSGRRRRQLGQKPFTHAGTTPDESVEHLEFGNLVEDRAEVEPVEQSEVFKIDEIKVRQGFPPDHWGRVG